MVEEKEKQRHHQDKREHSERSHIKGLFATVALSLGTAAAKLLLDSKRS